MDEKPDKPRGKKLSLGGMEGKLVITGDIISPAAGPEEWKVLSDPESVADPEPPAPPIR